MSKAGLFWIVIAFAFGIAIGCERDRNGAEIEIDPNNGVTFEVEVDTGD